MHVYRLIMRKYFFLPFFGTLILRDHICSLPCGGIHDGMTKIDDKRCNSIGNIA